MKWLAQIKQYIPCNEQEKKDQALILSCIASFRDVLTRSNEMAHITSSAVVVNQRKDKVLMVHHNIYNAWSWIGGHADGEAELLAVAMREVQEETGVVHMSPLTSEIFSLDVLPVLGHTRRGEYVSAHLHLSVAFLIEADENDALTINAMENSGVKWVPLSEMSAYTHEPHMQKLYDKLVSKIKKHL